MTRYCKREDKERELRCIGCTCDKVSESTLNDLLYGGAYNFKHQPERLKYIGKHKGWHQFEKVGIMGVWCELLDSDLHMIEETKDI